MTKKKSENKKESSKNAPKKTLIEIIKESNIDYGILMGALAKAGLLDQYRYEQSVYERKEITPSITDDELNKIIQDYLGE